MKVILSESRKVKDKAYPTGAEVIVKKDVGERMIEEGVANRLIEVPENRMRVIRYSGHKKIYAGSDGRKYAKKGNDYVEVKE